MPNLKKIHILLWVLVFFEGVIRLFELPIGIVRAGVPFLILFMLMVTIKKKQLYLPFINTQIILTIIIILSGLLNDIEVFQIIDFLTYLIFPYLYFIVLINEDDFEILKSIRLFIIKLFVIQLIAALIKLIIVGQAEDYIGTISLNAGSMSTIIPLIATSYLFPMYYNTGNKKYAFLIFLFAAFGIIGEKRAIVIMIPLLIFILLFIQNYITKKSVEKIVSSMFKISIIGLILIYIMIRLNPTLTPENEIGGTFDIEYVKNYILDYEKSNENERKRGEISRTEGLIYFFNYVNKFEIEKYLIGEGAGKLLINEDNPMELFYKVRYGGRMGVVWLLLQIGLVGMCLSLSIYIRIIYKTLKKAFLNREKSYNVDNFILIGLILTFLWDTIIYSSSSLMYFIIPGLIFFQYAYTLNLKKIE